ncbi:MAG: hypothetical protein ACRD8W_30015 [Nitrososphaeraceae archaeon]
MNKVFFGTLSCAFLLAAVAPAAVLGSPSSEENEDNIENNESNEEQMQEKCAVKLEDGRWLELDRLKDVELSDGTVIKGHTCEQLQQDYANITYAEYQDFLGEVDQVREEVGKMFMPDKPLSEQLEDLQNSIDKLNENLK